MTPAPPTTKVRCFSIHLVATQIVAAVVLATALATPARAAMDDPMPSYSISPTTNGLDVSYFAKQDKVKITLYLVNHEKFAITCDAEYSSGPEKTHARDQTFEPEKGVAFKFDYGRHASEVHVAFICIRADHANHVD